MLGSIKSKIEIKKFKKLWRQNNTHNQTVAGTIFPTDIVKVGSYSYGNIFLKTFNESIKTDKLIIGNFVSIADGVTFLLCDNHQTKTLTTFPLKSTFLKKTFPEDTISRGSIIVEDEVWIGYGATILSGVKIGKGAIIATGSVVSKNVPPYTVAGGVPATIAMHRFPKEIINRLMKLKLIDLPEEVIKTNIELLYKEIINEEDILKLELLFGKKDNEGEK